MSDYKSKVTSVDDILAACKEIETKFGKDAPESFLTSWSGQYRLEEIVRETMRKYDAPDMPRLSPSFCGVHVYAMEELSADEWLMVSHPHRGLDVMGFIRTCKRIGMPWRAFFGLPEPAREALQPSEARE